MKPVYSNIDFTQGAHVGGITKIQVVPREWLNSGLVQDHNTGKILTAVDLLAGKAFIELNFTQDSYEFTEKPKASKPGDYFETNIAGLLNDLDPATYQVLETLRYSQFVVLATDRQQRMRICGNIDRGMSFSFGTKNANAQNGNLTVSVDLDMQTSTAAPFYEV